LTDNAERPARFKSEAANDPRERPGTGVSVGRCSFMGERPGTASARRAVAKLIERYFMALKRQLAAQTDAFWARVEAATKAKAGHDKNDETNVVKKRADDAGA
jgi:hypothetical protein